MLQTEVEVERLNVLKASKMKELIFKRQSELEEIYKGVHMDVDSDNARQILINLMESGLALLVFLIRLIISSSSSFTSSVQSYLHKLMPILFAACYYYNSPWEGMILLLPHSLMLFC